jgi:hypothetical protein
MYYKKEVHVMNNIYGQSNNRCGCREREDSCTRPIQRTQPAEYRQPERDECRQLAGTVFRINIPAGAEINILNLIELASPSGICLILRLPFLAGECGQDHSHC